MAKRFESYEEAVKYLNEVDKSDLSQLSLARKNDDWTIAHELAIEDSLHMQYITFDVLKLARTDGLTVAHVLTWRGKLYKEKISLDILKLTRYTDGTTVAHSLASNGGLPKKFMTIEILLLDSNKGYVYEQLPKYNNLTIDSTKDTLELYLLAMSRYNYPKVDFDKFKELVDKHGLDKMKQMVKLTGKRDD